MLVTNLINKEKFHDLLVEKFPYLKKEIDDNAVKYLTSIELAYLRVHLEKAAIDKDNNEIKRIINFMDYLITNESKLHPEVNNAIYVPLFYDLFLGDKDIYNFLTTYFTKNMINIFNKIEEEYKQY